MPGSRPGISAECAVLRGVAGSATPTFGRGPHPGGPGGCGSARREPRGAYLTGAQPVGSDLTGANLDGPTCSRPTSVTPRSTVPPSSTPDIGSRRQRGQIDSRTHGRRASTAPSGQARRCDQLVTSRRRSASRAGAQAADLGSDADRRGSGGRTRTPNDWTRTSCVTDYTTPERAGRNPTERPAAAAHPDRRLSR